MPKLTPCKNHEFEDSIFQILNNKDEKFPLISLIIENSRDILLFDDVGEKKHVLEGHSSPVAVHGWLSSSKLLSISSKGNARLWIIKGPRYDCVKIQQNFQDPRSIVSISLSKQGKARFLINHSNGSCEIYEDDEFTGLTTAIQGEILYSTVFQEKIVLLFQKEGNLILGIYDSNLNELEKKKINYSVENVKKTALIISNGEIRGMVLLNKTGELSLYQFDDENITRLSDNNKIRSFQFDDSTRTLIIGDKDGVISTYGVNESFNEMNELFSFDAHDFGISALCYFSRMNSLATGSISGLLKFWKTDVDFVQKQSTTAGKTLISLKEEGKLMEKIANLKKLIQRNDIEKARYIFGQINPGAIKGFEKEYKEIKAIIEKKTRLLEEKKSKEHELITFLDRVAEERGSILLDEIVGTLGQDKGELVHIIESLIDEMDWEFVPKHECLFLFNRSTSIIQESAFEKEISYKGQYRVKQRQDYRSRPRREDDRKQKHAAGPRLEQDSLKNISVSENDQDLLKECMAQVENEMSAIVVERNKKVSDPIPVTDLVNDLEKITKPILYLVTDGIISPRLASVASEKKCKLVLGRRIHPKLDKEQVKMACLEFDNISMLKSLDSKDAREKDDRTDKDALMSPKRIEKLILETLQDGKWKKLDEILEESKITKSSDKMLAKIKIKQLVESGAIIEEKENGSEYFKTR